MKEGQTRKARKEEMRMDINKWADEPMVEPKEWTAERKKRLLDDHRLVHAAYQSLINGKTLYHRKGALAGKIITKEWLEKFHKWIVQHIFKLGYKHNMVDELDRTLPMELKDKSVQKTITIEDVLQGKKEELISALTTDSGSVLIPQKIDKNSVKWAIYVTAPHGYMIWKGQKTLIVKSVELKKHINEPLLLVSGTFAFGIIRLDSPQEIDQKMFQTLKQEHKITDEEAKTWGFDKKDKLYAYRVHVDYLYPKPKKIIKPKGLQNFTEIENIRVIKDQEEKKMLNVDEVVGLITDNNIQKSIMKLEMITPSELKKISRAQLIFIHLLLHRIYDNADRQKKNSPSNENLANWHSFVKQEMINRGIKHFWKNKLDDLSKEQPSQPSEVKKDIEEVDKSFKDDIKDALKNINDIVIINDYVCLVGSSVSRENPHDIDVLVRSDFRDPSLELKIGKVLKEGGLKHKIHWVWLAAGPHSSYHKIADYVVRIDKDLPFVEVKEDRYKNIKESLSDIDIEKSAYSYYKGLDEWKTDFIIDAYHTIKSIKGNKIIDIGCGTGRLLKMLSNSGYETTGIDKDKTAIDFCKRNGVNVIEYDIECGNLPFKDDEFDTAVLMHVIEHAEDPDKVINEASRISKNVVLIIPIGDCADTTHKRTYNIADIEKIANEYDASIHIYHIGRQERFNAIITMNSIETNKGWLKPGETFSPIKPAMAGYTEFFSIDELWDKWAEQRISKGIDIEEKLNGFRCIISKKGDAIKIWFEDSKQDRNKQLPMLVDELKKINDDFVLDCNIGINRNGKPLPRIKLMTLLANNPELKEGDEVLCTVFDLPYWKINLTEKSLSERREALENFFNKYLKGNKNFGITSYNVVNSKNEMATKAKHLASLPGSEGIVAKTIDSKYVRGGSDDWAKLKSIVEVKALVYNVQTNKNGTKSFYCGLLPGDSNYKNIIEYNGTKYVDLKKTMSSNVPATKGDIITVHVGEIIETEDDKLQWVIPRVIDVDKSRTEPYFAKQVVDMAERAHVLQKALNIVDEIQKTISPKQVSQEQIGEEVGKGPHAKASISFWEENWWKMYNKETGKFVLQSHWRGLSEEESKMTYEELLNTNNSVHQDLRSEIEPGGNLWGFSLFTGTAKDLKKMNGNSLANIDNSHIRGTHKLLVPRGWLNLKDGTVFAPTEPGATTKSYAKFFVIEKGSFKNGVWHRSFQEVFFNGPTIKGRYIFAKAQVGDQRFWLVSKPEDQKPYAETHNLETVIKELKSRGHKWLWWRESLESEPKLLDLSR